MHPKKAGDAVAACIKQAREAHLLTAGEERALFDRVRKSPCNGSDLGALVESFMPLVVYEARIARRTHEGHVDVADLIGAGREGLMLAVSRFDPGRGFRFATYAKWWVRKKILLEIRSTRLGEHVPDRVYRRRLKLLSRIRRLTNGTDSTRSIRDLAVDLDSTVKEIYAILRSVYAPPVSLDAPAREGAILLDFIAASTVSPEGVALALDLEKTVRKVLATLGERHEKAIRLSFGIGEEREYSFKEIGERLGVSAERARQMVSEGLRRCRDPRRARFLEAFVRA